MLKEPDMSIVQENFVTSRKRARAQAHPRSAKTRQYRGKIKSFATMNQTCIADSGPTKGVDLVVSPTVSYSINTGDMKGNASPKESAVSEVTIHQLQAKRYPAQVACSLKKSKMKQK